MTITALTNHHTRHQRRLRTVVKRLVIELGYLENCLAEGLQDANLLAAVADIDTAIACLNDHLSN
ncbi:MAG: hypothetical protein F6K42_05835 [Leptolyngbya sp. SIO1D8]|nr:hypothetical protein [Leptolyngbya sp. SIO1D8]